MHVSELEMHVSGPSFMSLSQIRTFLSQVSTSLGQNFHANPWATAIFGEKSLMPYGSVDGLRAFESVPISKQSGIFFLGGALPERSWVGGGGKVGRRGCEQREP